MPASDRDVRCMEEGTIVTLPSPGGEEKGCLESPRTHISGSTFTEHVQQVHPWLNILNGKQTTIFLFCLGLARKFAFKTHCSS